MTRPERYRGVLDYFERNHAIAETELQYSNPFQLLVAVVLSAQCTDKRVNMITPLLFEAFPDAQSLAQATSEDIFPYIRSISYPNNKAKHLAGLGRALVENHKSEVPGTLEALTALPGVGRKTANVILSVIYQQPTMAVDTHVYRVSKRIGLANLNASTPLAVEKTLIRYIPKDQVPRAHHWLILHGRYICLARNPKCQECPITSFCRYYQKKTVSASRIGD